MLSRVSSDAVLHSLQRLKAVSAPTAAGLDGELVAALELLRGLVRQESVDWKRQRLRIVLNEVAAARDALGRREPDAAQFQALLEDALKHYSEYGRDEAPRPWFMGDDEGLRVV
jgi:hypothetical protein